MQRDDPKSRISGDQCREKAQELMNLSDNAETTEEKVRLLREAGEWLRLSMLRD